MYRIMKYVMLDILKNKILLFYTLLLAILSWSVFSLEDNATKGLLTLLNMVLLTVPLIAVIFSAIYVYNCGEFIELLVSQPIKRTKIYFSIFTGLSISLLLAFMVGAGIPILIFAFNVSGLHLIIAGIFSTMVFTALAFLSASLTRDKAKGLGIAILTWLFFALLFDGIILFLVFQFADYPIEKMMIGISVLSPIDLSRILVLLELDVSAMMGYTGAIFKEFFGTFTGRLFTILLLILWTIIPFLIAMFRFRKKDL